LRHSRALGTRIAQRASVSELRTKKQFRVPGPEFRIPAEPEAWNPRLEPGKPLRLGFVPLADCAPLVVAHEFGFFRKYGLNVTLCRELGWATIRDKVIHGELDAAHALAAMPVAATLGLGSIKCDCLTAMVLNLHGNAITLSNELWRAGVREAASLRSEITRLRHRKTLTFGVVSQFSSHHFLLRQWLMAAGIYPDRDVRIVVVPPPQMVANLKAGHLDGFCVGEPWNSVAVQSRTGWCVTTSAELAPNHPEKVLMVRRDFAEKKAEQHVALVAALLEACEFCDAAENRDELVSMLARPEYVDASAAALRHGFSGEFDFGQNGARTVRDFSIFHRDNANEPSSEKAGWVMQLIRASGQCPDASALTFALSRRLFRMDIFEKAVQLRESVLSHKKENETQTENQVAPV
jgi:ABC-type nitrate/sulfonate/bicarbonate transport system substrate-binding protein